MPTNQFEQVKKNKVNEFYMQLPDIEAKMRHYKEQFRGKVVFCNCDAPFESNFFKYFALNFNFWGLKKNDGNLLRRIAGDRRTVVTVRRTRFAGQKRRGQKFL